MSVQPSGSCDVSFCLLILRKELIPTWHQPRLKQLTVSQEDSESIIPSPHRQLHMRTARLSANKTPTDSRQDAGNRQHSRKTPPQSCPPIPAKLHRDLHELAPSPIDALRHIRNEAQKCIRKTAALHVANKHMASIGTQICLEQSQASRLLRSALQKEHQDGKTDSR